MYEVFGDEPSEKKRNIVLQFVEQNKTFILITDRKIAWYDAVYVCWRDYSSLASISNEMEYNTILNMTKDLGISFWFGLYENAISWTWSISLDTDNSLELCGSVTNISWWRECDCTAVKPFFCYDGKKHETMFCLLFPHSGPSFLLLLHCFFCLDQIYSHARHQAMNASMLPPGGH